MEDEVWGRLEDAVGLVAVVDVAPHIVAVIQILEDIMLHCLCIFRIALQKRFHYHDIAEENFDGDATCGLRVEPAGQAAREFGGRVEPFEELRVALVRELRHVVRTCNSE